MLKLTHTLAGLVLACASTAYAQTANFQVIHNCASPVAATVDVYVGADKLLSGFAFRTATPYLPVPAGVPLQVRVKPASAASDTSNPLFFGTYTLPAGGNVVAIASGNVGPGFAANPNGVSTAFDLIILTDGRLSSTQAGQAQVKIFHGVTDAPAVRIKTTGTGTVLVPSAQFTQSSGWLDLPPSDVNVDVDAAPNGPTVASFLAPLSAFADSALLVLASGYLNPTANNNGPAFGLLAVTPGGRALLLTQNGSIQIIHNAAAPAASSVDIWVNNARLLTNFSFRSATPYITVPSGVPLQVRIKLPNSTDTANPVLFRQLTVPVGQDVVAIATGNVGTGFAANPEGVSTALDLEVLADGRLSSTAAGQAQIRVFHGATDAPAVRIKVNGAGTVLVPQAQYRQSSGWLDAGNQNIGIDVDVAPNGPTVATFLAPLSAFADSALLVLASGYLNPTANNNGPAFGLLAVTPRGNTVLLPAGATSTRNRIAGVLELVPNPARDRVSVKLPEGVVREVRVVDLTGRTLSVHHQATVDLTNVSPGMYTLTTLANDGRVYTSRLIRE